MRKLLIRPGRRLPVVSLRTAALATAAGLALSAATFASANAVTVVTVTSHFVWTPTSASLTGDTTFINNGATNHQPKDLVFITPNLTPNGISPCPCVLVPQPVYGVWYNGKQWGVFDEDQTIMVSQWSFNVLVVPKAKKSAFVHTATAPNTSGNHTLLNSSLLNGKPWAKILVTQNWDPGGKGGVFNVHQVGVRYYKAAKKWGIFNEDGSKMTLFAAFNVLVGQAPSNGGKMTVVKATNSNRSGSAVIFSNGRTNGNPNNVTLVTQVFNPGGKGGIADKRSADVAYNGSKEAVLNFVGPVQKIGTAYNVLIFSS